MNYENEIVELKKRIEFLEKAEHKRIIKRRNEIIFNVIKFVLIIGMLIYGYFYLYNNIIKPYQETVDNYTEKFDSVESYIDEQLDSFQDLNLFS